MITGNISLSNQEFTLAAVSTTANGHVCRSTWLFLLNRMIFQLSQVLWIISSILCSNVFWIRSFPSIIIHFFDNFYASYWLFFPCLLIFHNWVLRMENLHYHLIQCWSMCMNFHHVQGIAVHKYSPFYFAEFQFA